MDSGARTHRLPLWPVFWSSDPHGGGANSRLWRGTRTQSFPGCTDLLHLSFPGLMPLSAGAHTTGREAARHHFCIPGQCFTRIRFARDALLADLKSTEEEEYYSGGSLL